MVASNRLGGEHGDHAVAIPGTTAKVLRTAVIYGANGAGKSNLYKALEYLRRLAVFRGGTGGTSLGREPFRLGSATQCPTAFDVQFLTSGKLYRYAIELDDQRVLEESLSESLVGGEKVIFQRGQERDVALGVEEQSLPRLAALATVGAPPDQSFLGAITNAYLPPPDTGPDIASVIRWFRNGLVLLAPDHSPTSVWGNLNDDPSLRDFVSDFLRMSSTGVDRLEVVKSQLSHEELSSLVGEGSARQLADYAGNGGRRLIPVGRGDTWIEAVAEEGCRLVRFQSAHKDQDGKIVKMDLADESDGTRRLLDLLPAIHQLQKSGGVYFVDEIDRSMHPILVKRLFELFLSSCRDSMSQLIVTTHESNLLDLDLLRRDEIWFAEKDHEQATRLYSLADFKVRKDLEIRKNYLQGRFGAIPFLGSLDSLMKGQNGNE